MDTDVSMMRAKGLKGGWVEGDKGGGKWGVSATIERYLLLIKKNNNKKKTPVAQNDLSEVTQLRAA